MWRKLSIGALAIVAFLVWYLLLADRRPSLNPFGEDDAERVGREYGRERTGWQEIKVDVSGARGGQWYVVVSRVPAMPGARFTLELDENGKVTQVISGK